MTVNDGGAFHVGHSPPGAAVAVAVAIAEASDGVSGDWLRDIICIA